MELDFNSEKPIFQQIAEGLEDSILSGAVSYTHLTMFYPPQ